MNIPDIKVKRLTNTAKLPTRATSGSAGYDLYTDISEPMLVPPHATVKFGTGVAITPPDDTAGFIFARSGSATKRGLAPANKVGICDIDYTGEYVIALHNHSDEEQIVEVGERVAQLVFLPVIVGNMIEVDKLDVTSRGSGGFGSTGHN